MYSFLFSPDSKAPVDWYDGVFEAYREATIGRVKSRLAAELSQVLRTEYEIWFDPENVAAAWCPEMGYLNSLLSRQDGIGTNAAAQYLLCAAASGGECDCGVPTEAGRELYFRGFRFVTGEWTRIRCEGKSLSLNDWNTERMFEHSDANWREVGTGQEIQMRRAIDKLIFVGGDCIDAELKTHLDGVLPWDGFLGAMEMTLRAFRTIADISPEYSSWCTRVLRQVQLVGSKSVETRLSHSAASRPGGIVMSHPGNLVHYMEAIVHECTHQYFYMLTMMTRLKRDPSDQALFYSSIVSRRRPIDRILMAYHATANIVRFLSIVRKKCPDLEPAAHDRAVHHGGICRQLQRVLVANSEYLTEGAGDFWLSSKDAIADLIS
jgi:HEXXH motif-containing protein